MDSEVKVGRRDATLVMSKRLPVRLSAIGNVIGSSFGEVYGFLGSHGITPAGPPFIIYHGTPMADNPFDIEVCAPIGRATEEAPAGWRVQELPAGLFATMLHVGPYDTLGAAYSAMTGWVVAHDLTVQGPPREVYLSEPGTAPEQVKTIIEFPVAEAATPAGTR